MSSLSECTCSASDSGINYYYTYHYVHVDIDTDTALPKKNSTFKGSIVNILFFYYY